MKLAFEPHKITQQQLRALHDSVLVTDMAFEERITQSGLILPNDNGTGNGIRPRWGRVYAVGDEQLDVKVGQWIMVAHGRWTRGIDIDDGERRTLRRVAPNDILLVADGPECPQDDTQSDAVHVTKQSHD